MLCNELALIYNPCYLIDLPLLLILMSIAYKDYRTYTIPNTYLLLLLPLLLINLPQEPLSKILNFFLFGGIFLGLYLFSNGLGAGDVKLIALLTLWFNFPQNLLFTYLIIFLGTVHCLLLALYYRRRKIIIPLAPSIVLAAIISKFFSQTLLHWWLG